MRKTHLHLVVGLSVLALRAAAPRWGSRPGIEICWRAMRCASMQIPWTPRSMNTCTSARKHPPEAAPTPAAAAAAIEKTPSPRAASQVRRQLMAASCALLGAGAAQSQEAAGTQKEESPLNRLLEGVSFDSALAYYREDGRIQAIEPVVNVSKTFAGGDVASLDVTFDSLSGASPNGAVPSNVPQTFASPSGTSLTTGRHLYTIAPGRLPADPHYQDDPNRGGGRMAVASVPAHAPQPRRKAIGRG